MKETLEYWRAMYEALASNADRHAVDAAKNIVLAAVDISDSRGISFGSAHSALMSTLFGLRAANTKKRKRR